VGASEGGKASDVGHSPSRRREGGGRFLKDLVFRETNESRGGGRAILVATVGTLAPESSCLVLHGGRGHRAVWCATITCKSSRFAGRRDLVANEGGRRGSEKQLGASWGNGKM